jgi:TPR repeat protein
MEQDGSIGSLVPKPPSSPEKAQPVAKRIFTVMGAEILAQTPTEETEAMYLKACAYRDGEGVPQDHAQAVHRFRKAAEQGDAGAQFNLGGCYFYSYGVARGYAQAVYWYRKAAEQGHVDAQFSLGICYTFGHGVAQDYAQALKWHRKAAEKKNAKAQGNLEALKGRDLLAEQMTLSQITGAQRLAKEWKPHGGNYKD